MSTLYDYAPFFGWWNGTSGCTGRDGVDSWKRMRGEDRRRALRPSSSRRPHNRHVRHVIVTRACVTGEHPRGLRASQAWTRLTLETGRSSTRQNRSPSDELVVATGRFRIRRIPAADISHQIATGKGNGFHFKQDQTDITAPVALSRLKVAGRPVISQIRLRTSSQICNNNGTRQIKYSHKR